MSRRLFTVTAALALAFPAAAFAQLKVEKRADLAQPAVLGPNQGAILVGFRRPDKMSAGKSGVAAFARYDSAKRDLILQPRDAKKLGDQTTYWVLARSGNRKLTLDHAVMVVSAGDYVLFGASPGPGGLVTNTFCLGAPTFRVNAGEVVYFGDLTPYLFVKLEDGSPAMAMAYSYHPDDARKALAGQPSLAAAFRPAALRNDATYGCAAQTMLAYEVPGAPPLEPVSSSASLQIPPAAPAP